MHGFGWTSPLRASAARTRLDYLPTIREEIFHSYDDIQSVQDHLGMDSLMNVSVSART